MLGYISFLRLACWVVERYSDKVSKTVICHETIGDYKMRSRNILDTWDTTRTSRMESYRQSILRRSTPNYSISDITIGCSINMGSVFRDHVANPAKPTLKCRTSLDKLLAIDEINPRPTLVLGRNLFLAIQQFVRDVVFKLITASCVLVLYTRQTWFLISTRPQNGEITDQRNPRFQYRDICRFCSLSSSTYSRENPLHSGQCETAQSNSSKSFEIYYGNWNCIVCMFLLSYPLELNLESGVLLAQRLPKTALLSHFAKWQLPCTTLRTSRSNI